METQRRQLTSQDQKAADAQLVKATLAGSPDAFAQLYQTYLSLLFYFVHKQVRSDEDASDIVQDTFVYALVKLDELKEPANFRSWLFRIALSKAIDVSRKTQRHAQDLDFDDPNFDEEAALPPSGASTSMADFLPELAIDREEVRAELLTHLRQLSTAQKDMLILHYYVGLSTVAIADQLEITQGAVRKRLYDARVALATLLPAGIQGVSSATNPASEEKIARLLAEDCQSADRATSAEARHMVDSRLTVALPALLATGTLDPAATARVQAFLNHFIAPVGASTNTENPAETETSASNGLAKKIIITAAACVLIALLATGVVLAVERKDQHQPPAPTAQNPQTAAPAAVATPDPNAVSSIEATTVAPSTAATTAPAPAPVPPKPAPAQTPAPAQPKQPASKPKPAPAPTPAPAPPTLTARTLQLSYQYGAVLTPARLVTDAGASAYAASGTRLAVTVLQFGNINTTRPGTYLVYLTAQDGQGQQAPPLVLHVTIEAAP
ncbi:MAG: sigma-70 family RNA polymerase sigma factor [Coriobacteriia bacterium]|nr:sigma-70 family RNA polymerase sigma factor [Coriobacteriia bacterium]